MKPSRLVAEWSALAIATWLVALIVIYSQAGQRADDFLYDAAMVASVDQANGTSQTLIVAIDNRSIDDVGPWPWSRERIASLVDEIDRHGPRVIVVDILFPESRPGDAELAKAIRTSGKVVLPIGVEAPGYNGQPYALIEPTGMLSGATRVQGHASVLPDRDGVVRSIERVIEIGDRRVLHAAVAAAAAHPAPNIEPAPAATGIEPSVRLAFSAMPGDYPTVSASEVLKGNVPPELFAGRDVLVGSFASGLGDTYATPLGTENQNLSGVELMASALAAERQGSWITLPQRPVIAIGTLLFLTLAVIAFLRLNATGIIVVSVASLVAIASLALVLLRSGVWISPAAAICGLLFASLVWIWRRLRFVDRAISTEFPLKLKPAGNTTGSLFSDPLEERLLALKRNLAALEQSNLSLDTLVHNLPDPTLCLDLDGRITLTNDATNRLFERVAADPWPADITALSNLFVPVGDPTDAGARTRHLGLDVDGHLIVPPELRTRKGDWFVAATQALSQPPRWIVTLSDITHIKQSIAARERSLQFLSHDIRSPIAAAIALIDRTEGGGQDDPASAHLDEAKGRLHRALSMADQHVLLTKAEEANYAPARFDLVSCAQEAADTCALLATQKRVEIREHFPHGSIEVHAHEPAIARCIANLLKNAILHGSAGDDTVRLSAFADGRWANVAIEDGDAATVATMRQAIEHYDESGQLRHDIGLGLAYCATVARKNNGLLEIFENDGRKSVILRLPLATPRADFAQA